MCCLESLTPPPPHRAMAPCKAGESFSRSTVRVTSSSYFDLWHLVSFFFFSLRNSEIHTIFNARGILFRFDSSHRKYLPSQEGDRCVSAVLPPSGRITDYTKQTRLRKEARREWFPQLLPHSLALSPLCRWGSYVCFGRLSSAV